MKFNLSDFLQLDTKGLLAVNGGYNCNGSTNNTVYPNTYYSGNGESTNGGGGNDHNGKNWYSKGDIVDSIPRGGTFIKSDGKSFTYSFGSGKSKNTTTFQKNPDGTYLVTYNHYDGPVTSNGSKNSGGSSGGGSCSTPTTGSNNSNGQGYSQTSSNPGKGSSDKEKKDNTPHVGGTCPGTGGGTHIPPSDDGSGTGEDDGTETPNGGGICGGTGGSGEGETESGGDELGTEENTETNHAYQVPNDPNDYHCDINSYNVAIDNNRENPGDWDGNNLSVDEIFTQNYTEDATDTPLVGTQGYGFYDNDGDGSYDHMYYYDYTNGGNSYHVWNSDGIQPVTESDWSINGTAVDHSVYVPLN